MAAETKTCPDCEQVIGATEATCPKCQWDFESFDDETLSKLERAQGVLRKRQKAREEEELKKNPPKPPKKKNFFAGLGAASQN